MAAVHRMFIYVYSVYMYILRVANTVHTSFWMDVQPRAKSISYPVHIINSSCESRASVKCMK